MEEKVPMGNRAKMAVMICGLLFSCLCLSGAIVTMFFSESIGYVIFALGFVGIVGDIAAMLVIKLIDCKDASKNKHK